MQLILIPGLWLDGSSWDAVVPGLERAGHDVRRLTLPGMQSRSMDRSGVTLRECVNAVVAAIDDRPGPVVLVAHSAACGIAHAAVDARPDQVSRAVYVGGFPTGPGSPVAGEFPTENGEIPLPDWSTFEDEDLADLDEHARAAFRSRAIPSPARLTSDPQELSDERRYDVPVTVVCTEFSSPQLKKWIAQDLAPVREFPKIKQVQYVDLPTGHWPQFTRPVDLARALLVALHTTADLLIDEAGRPEPPSDGDEVQTLLGFLDYQRATLAWKCGGLDSAGLRARVGASAITLGGLLKHLAYVENDWFGRWLHGRDRQPPWDTVDWGADPDWEWHSAADDSAEQLFALWEGAVTQSRQLVDDALAVGGLEQLTRRTAPDGRAPSLRWVLTHMIEEYARHNGHADLLRESVDGATGE